MNPRPPPTPVLARGLPALVPVLAILIALGSSPGCSTRRYSGPPSDHFDGERFRNEPDVGAVSAGDLLRWKVLLPSQDALYPEAIDGLPGARPPRRVSDGRLRLTYVNHATVLVQMDGVNLLTDPVYAERVSPVEFAGPKRRRRPGLRFEDLPPIDAVVVSHDHYDHMDLETLARLARRDRPRFFVGLGNRSRLEEVGISGVFEMDWWQVATLASGVRLHCVPAQHQSNRALTDRQRTLWCGYVLEGPSGRVFFAGDTGLGPHMARVGERFGGVRAALLPIGAYEPRWFMQRHHMNPADAVAAHHLLGAETSVAIHHGTFDLADEGEATPVIELLQALARDAAARRSAVARFWTLEHGEGRDVP